MSDSSKIEAAVIIEDDVEAIFDDCFLGRPYWIATFKLCRCNGRLIWKGSSLILSGGGYVTHEEAVKELIRSRYKVLPLLRKTYFRSTENFSLDQIRIPYEENPL